MFTTRATPAWEKVRLRSCARPGVATSWLVDRGVDVNEVAESGEAAIHSAVGSSAIIRLLAGRGARLDLKNQRGQTPLDLALARDPSDVSAKLLQELIARK